MASELRMPLIRLLPETATTLLVDLTSLETPPPPAPVPLSHDVPHRHREAREHCSSEGCEPRVHDHRRDLRPGLGRWSATVRQADEAALLVDTQGRLLALSPAACSSLGLSAHSLGRSLGDVLHVVDHTAAALLLPEPAEGLPPLRVLRAGVPVARSLVRLRMRDDEATVATYDVVGVAVTGGALAFFSEV